MEKVISSFLLLLLLCSCNSDPGTMEPELIEARNMSIVIEMEGDYGSYDTQVTVFSFGEQKVAVNGGMFDNAVSQYDVSQGLEHTFNFDDELVVMGLRIALGQLKEGMGNSDSAVVNISAFINNELFDKQVLVTTPESERDTIGYIYNALGEEFIEFDTRD